ncbi:hypothetical protein [Brevibacillus marinus]|uniref:hypothetical protein n=1 Tax=Brevibacillus marinus TaxID=2496837 RepID=UPI000F817875|nr:hypothetical protein [Brevibacillus marinus]
MKRGLLIPRRMLNEKGTVLIEKQVILAVAITGILGLASLMLPWLQMYFHDTGDAISNAGRASDFRSVTWR